MSTIPSGPPGGGNNSTTHIDGTANDHEAEVENSNRNNNFQRQTMRGPSIHNSNGKSIKDRFKKGIKAVDTSDSPSVRQPDSNGNSSTDESQSSD